MKIFKFIIMPFKYNFPVQRIKSNVNMVIFSQILVNITSIFYLKVTRTMFIPTNTIKWQTDIIPLFNLVSNQLVFVFFHRRVNNENSNMISSLERLMLFNNFNSHLSDFIFWQNSCCTILKSLTTIWFSNKSNFIEFQSYFCIMFHVYLKIFQNLIKIFIFLLFYSQFTAWNLREETWV